MRRHLTEGNKDVTPRPASSKAAARIAASELATPARERLWSADMIVDGEEERKIKVEVDVKQEDEDVKQEVKQEDVKEEAVEAEDVKHLSVDSQTTLDEIRKLKVRFTGFVHYLVLMRPQDDLARLERQLVKTEGEPSLKRVKREHTSTLIPGEIIDLTL
ncbi:hypothetical protein NMY22_g4624 [Coprinellus aureogranulatus]|nr:hypothetical protein NMY22_g4624 [Coprinellus aureogranulatus]